jgi:predicted nucleic acid-binding Zn ribbon protein
MLFEPTHPLAMADGYVAEHRKLAWDAGLLTDPALHVHHDNEDKTDNTLGNLVPKTSSTHNREHHPIGSIIRNQHGEGIVGQGIASLNRARKQAAGRRACEVCGVDITALRLDAQVCGNNCRVKRWKAKNQGGAH